MTFSPDELNRMHELGAGMVSKARDHFAAELKRARAAGVPATQALIVHMKSIVVMLDHWRPMMATLGQSTEPIAFQSSFDAIDFLFDAGYALDDILPAIRAAAAYDWSVK